MKLYKDSGTIVFVVLYSFCTILAYVMFGGPGYGRPAAGLASSRSLQFTMTTCRFMSMNETYFELCL